MLTEGSLSPDSKYTILLLFEYSNAQKRAYFNRAGWLDGSA
jgi:hypothetical protein